MHTSGLPIMIDRSHQCWTASAYYDLLVTPWWLIDPNTKYVFLFMLSIQDKCIRSFPLMRINYSYG